MKRSRKSFPSYAGGASIWEGVHVSQRLVRLLTTVIGVVLLVSAGRYVNTPSTMSQTAVAFLKSLNADQRGKTTFQFDDDERLNFHFIPKERKGLTLGEMSAEQKHLATSLLSAGLSQSGYIKATTIMSIEDILRIVEKDTKGRRNPEKYHFSVFGDPAGTAPWGYRVEGHHLSLNFAVVNGKLAGAPAFFGSNPHEVREGPRAGLRILGREEDLARTLALTLTPEQRKTAVVAEKAYNDIITAASRKASLQGQPSGLSAAKMNPKQREMLAQLVAEYAYNLADPIAEDRMARLKKAGTNIFFAWAGTTDKGGPHYYRVQAPTFLIEYDNTQNQANHSHTVWRDMEGDFGLDLLGAHHAASHSK
jgi:hypothetical protein